MTINTRHTHTQGMRKREVEDRRLKTMREMKQDTADKLKRERQERRKIEQQEKKEKRKRPNGSSAGEVDDNKRRAANKELSPEEARGEKGEDITGKRKREEEEKPD